MGKVWWIAILALAVVSAGMGSRRLLLMTTLFALIGLASHLWTRHSLDAVTYRRRFGSRRVLYGEETELQVEITNAKPLPLAWLRAEDEFPADLQITPPMLGYGRPGRRSLINLLSMRWYERVTRHYQVRGTRRGAWALGPVRLSSGDIFGFAVQRETRDDVEDLVVYPKTVPITALGLPAHHPFGDLRTHRRVLEDPLLVMGARDYAPGDSFRHIHWRATARRQALQTKVFEPSATRPIAIFLNVNTYEYVYEGIDLELQELAITAAASIARWAWEQGLQVGLFANSITQPTGERVRIMPGSHTDQLLWIMEALARLVIYGRWPIESVLQVESFGLRYGTTVVVISAVITERLRQTLLDLRRREHAVTLIALGDARLAYPLPGVGYYHIGGREVWRELEGLELA
ncbi:MAG: DUF58 domain-containing protein [Anaerolineae bacterium]